MYEELYREGEVAASYMLPYAVLLMRSGEEGAFEKVKEIMVKAQKAPDMNAERKQQLLMNYAVASWKTGDLDKGIRLLEASHREAPCGLTYQSLGFLYVEQGDGEKALAYNQEALEYDDEDPVILDNLGQTYYRLLKDKEKARPYFEKAHAVKPSQIDTLYFLSRYDLDEGKRDEALEKLEETLEGRFSPLNYVTREMAEAEVSRLKDDMNKGEGAGA
jgi:tetratricopeptide (TPR) repeat protein